MAWRKQDQIDLTDATNRRTVTTGKMLRGIASDRIRAHPNASLTHPGRPNQPTIGGKIPKGVYGKSITGR